MVDDIRERYLANRAAEYAAERLKEAAEKAENAEKAAARRAAAAEHVERKTIGVVGDGNVQARVSLANDDGILRRSAALSFVQFVGPSGYRPFRKPRMFLSSVEARGLAKVLTSAADELDAACETTPGDVRAPAPQASTA